jgi:hypothetical protein
MLGTHVESNGAHIDNREEYGSSTYSSHQSYEDNIDFDGESKSMS